MQKSAGNELAGESQKSINIQHGLLLMAIINRLILKNHPFYLPSYFLFSCYFNYEIIHNLEAERMRTKSQ